MLGGRDSSSRLPVTALFWEAFDATGAISALMRSGFAENDIYALGVLSGGAPNFGDMLLAMGIPLDDASVYSNCLGDGAMLLIVHTEPGHNKKAALEVLERHGGVFPPATKAIHE
jgi:hypothetical protein